METQQVIDNLISMKTEIEFESDDTKKMKRIKIDTINEAIKALKKQMEIYLGGKKVTNKQLERGVELKTLKDGLWRRKEHLEKMKEICFENMDIAKKVTHTFTIKLMLNDGGDSDAVEVSARAAYRGICSDIETIEKEIEKLNKEFSNL